MIYCEYISWKQHISGVIWTRVPLSNYRMSKTLRRTRRRVEEEFVIDVHPAILDQEHELIYQRYLTIAPGERSTHVEDVLLGGHPDRDLFDTWEVSIRTATGELVGFSWFDRGETSLQSIIGVYEPDYAPFSLGLYTMIRELNYGLEHGYEYYYAGYILCDDTAMHYKLRTGSIQYLDRTQHRWVPRDTLDVSEHDPMRRTYDALELAGKTSLFEGWQLYHNRHFELSAYAPNLTSCMYYPAALWRTESDTSPFVIALSWDSVTQQYELLRCLRGVLATPDGSVTIRDLFVVDRSLGKTSEIPTLIPSAFE
jgi:arginyl-tRNA--protein-N-Asp/Glu arginylyltransferase